MKSVIEKMNKCYAEKCKNFNKSFAFCHSMNGDNYKIVYKDFFDDQNNVLLEQSLAKEVLFCDCENVFVDWLKEEWNDKKGRDLLCRP